MRLLFGLLAFVVNMGIFVAVLAVFIKEGYYNESDYDVWIYSFFFS